MELRRIKFQLERFLGEEEEGLFCLAQELHKHPELSFKEFRSSGLLVDYLVRKGFKVQRGLAGLSTAFRAFSRNAQSHPAIGFLAEMDALSGLGHGCGHNLIGVASAGAGVILRRAFPGLKGSVEVIGCPAEEQGGGKVLMARAGVFDHLDLAMLVHPSNRTEIYKLSLALVEVELLFLGKPAHASAGPEKGVNALEALIQTFNSINSLRAQLPSTVRINGIIREGGKAPNIIPDRARAEFWVRAEGLREALELADKVVGIARASARAIGGKVRTRVHQSRAYAPFVPNRTAGEVLWRIYEELGIKIEQGDERAELGSTDLGNLSWRVPALHPTIAISQAMPHSLEFAKASGTRTSWNLMKKAILAMALLGFRVMTDAGLRREMKSELRKKRLAQ